MVIHLNDCDILDASIPTKETGDVQGEIVPAPKSTKIHQGADIMTDKSLWEEALQEFQKQREETKTIEFPVGTGVVRFDPQLTQADKDRIESGPGPAGGRSITAAELARPGGLYPRRGGRGAARVRVDLRAPRRTPGLHPGRSRGRDREVAHARRGNRGRLSSCGGRARRLYRLRSGRHG